MSTAGKLQDWLHTASVLATRLSATPSCITKAVIIFGPVMVKQSRKPTCGGWTARLRGRFRVDERVGVARADDAPAVLSPAEEIRPPLPDAGNPVHPGEDPSLLQRADRLVDGRASAVGALGDALIAREAAARSEAHST
jgi:hypothetical protein